MKKSLFIITLICVSSLVFGQRTVLFEENFENIGLIPNTWVLANVDGLTPDDPDLASMADSAWIVLNSTTFGSKIAMGVSYYTAAGNTNDWMILPQVTLGNTSKLKWDAMSLTSSGDYPDSYKVWLSTTTQNVAGCTNLLLSVEDEAWRITAPTPGLGVQSHEVDLSAFAGQPVYIAFQLMTPDPGGDRLAIDNIKIIDGLSSIKTQENASVNIYPNPALNFLNINSSETLLSCEVFNMMGQTVFKINENIKTIDLSNFNKGIYTIKLYTQKGSFTQKFSVIK